jgi:hypothetical protein
MLLIDRLAARPPPRSSLGAIPRRRCAAAVRDGGTRGGQIGGQPTAQERSETSGRAAILRIYRATSPGPASFAGSSPVTHPIGRGPGQFADRGLSVIGAVDDGNRHPVAPSSGGHRGGSGHARTAARPPAPQAARPPAAARHGSGRTHGPWSDPGSAVGGLSTGSAKYRRTTSAPPSDLLGRAALFLACLHSSAPRVEPAVTRAVGKVVSQATGLHIHRHARVARGG